MGSPDVVITNNDAADFKRLKIFNVCVDAPSAEVLFRKMPKQ